MIEEIGSSMAQYVIKGIVDSKKKKTIIYNEIIGDDDDWNEALKEGMTVPKGAISVRNKRAVQVHNMLYIIYFLPFLKLT